MTKAKRVNSIKEVDETTVNNNLNLVVVKAKKSTIVKGNLRAMQQELKDIDYSQSNSIVKDSKQVSYTFSNARAMQLSLVRNDKRLSKYEQSKVIDLLKRSAVSKSKIKPEDENLYATLRAVSAFAYKVHKTVDANKVTTINIVKSFNAKQVLNSCDTYMNYSSTELTMHKINAIQVEYTLQAVEKCTKDVTTAQSKLANIALLVESIDSIKDKSEDQKLRLKDLIDQQTAAENSLLLKQQISEYVKLASNRKHIK